MEYEITVRVSVSGGRISSYHEALKTVEERIEHVSTYEEPFRVKIEEVTRVEVEQPRQRR